MQAKREVSKLYDDIKKPPYIYLFNPGLTAMRMWRCIEILRAVDAALKEQQQTREGREKLVAVHGNRFVLHGIIKRMATIDLDDPALDMDALKARLPAVTAEILEKTIAQAKHLYPNAYPSNLFKNVSKCRDLIKHVLTPTPSSTEQIAAGD